ncbi:MAG: YihY/virulence factor BrkB family protein [Bacilli bacterium]|nr:YihY/virulence factor BrkB family protein [Bacilli bacterium]
MDKIKRYIKKIFKILSLKELSILPAYLSYSLILAIIPIVTIIVLLLGIFGISIDTITSIIGDIFPSYVSNVIISAISGKSFDLSIGILNLITFVIAANGMYAIINASNNLYKIESESQINDRLRSLTILIIMILLLVFMIIVPMLGNKIIDIISNYDISSNTIKFIEQVYSALKWPITFVFLFFAIKLIYIIAPSKKIKSEETTIGAFITTVGWILFTAIFGFYINYFAKYDIIYGGLSSIIILLIWVYVLSFILVLGIIINTVKYNK